MDISASIIDQWHKDRGWREIGYNHFIKREGEIEQGRSLVSSGAHTLGRNSDSVGVCYAGGMSVSGKPEDNITPMQMASILELFRAYKEVYPGIKISGHNQHNKKDCPCFDMREYARKHGLEESDILQSPLLVSI